MWRPLHSSRWLCLFLCLPWLSWAQQPHLTLLRQFNGVIDYSRRSLNFLPFELQGLNLTQSTHSHVQWFSCAGRSAEWVDLHSELIGTLSSPSPPFPPPLLICRGNIQPFNHLGTEWNATQRNTPQPTVLFHFPTLYFPLQQNSRREQSRTR